MSTNYTSVQEMLNDPGLVDARQVLADLKSRGFEVFISSSSIMVIGIDAAKVPSRADIDLAHSVLHEIGLIYAVTVFAQHFLAVSETDLLMEKFISGVPDCHDRSATAESCNVSSNATRT